MAVRAPWSSFAPLLAVLALSGLQSAQAQDFHELPISVAGGAPPRAQEPWLLLIDTDDAAGLAKVLAAPVPAPGARRFEYMLKHYLPPVSESSRTWLESTFVIDHDEKPVQALSAQWRNADSQHSLDSLLRLVATTIDENVDRGFDVASTVAERRQGDCTEHAVLTAALARAAGIPARVVLGTVLVRKHDEFGAFGHAWAELREGGHWVIADAALVPDPAGIPEGMTIRYLPAGLLENEGLGYSMDLMRVFRRWTQRITIMGQDAR